MDLAVASWFDVTGVRPHRDRLTSGVDREPVEGDGAGPLVARLVEALAPGARMVDVAAWDGYGFGDAGAADRPFIRVHSRSYRQRALPAVEAADLFRSNDEAGWPRLVPNLVWRRDEWCLSADIDCMSTYLGTSNPPPDLDELGLEWVRVKPQDRVA